MALNVGLDVSFENAQDGKVMWEERREVDSRLPVEFPVAVTPVY
jgi:hypothetical protein